MSRIFYLSGQRTFGNRGCEAIVRSTVMMLREAHGDVTVLVPSDNIERDSRQWPEASSFGVKFVTAYKSKLGRYWVQCQRLPVGWVKRAKWPFQFPQDVIDDVRSADVVLAVGGDNYSLDYRIPSPIVALDALALDLGKPVYLWGASVGPFDKEPLYLPAIKTHLSRMKTIFVRERVSYNYLVSKLDLKNVQLIADPAFNLKPEGEGAPELRQDGNSCLLGLNISPLIEKYRREGQDLIQETAEFVRHVVLNKKFKVVLIPHVSELNDSDSNSDFMYMKSLKERVSDLGHCVELISDDYNAAQLKYVIGKMTYFIGARTHATIAAMSSCVPTISIAYSVKARGINNDIFGSEEMVLPTPELSNSSLTRSLEWLIKNEEKLKVRMMEQLPKIRAFSFNALKSI